MSDARNFEFFKVLLEDVRETRKARRELSNVFTTLNLAGVGALGFLRADNEGQTLSPELAVWLVVALSLTCFIWWTSNSYYTKLLGVKFGIIKEYENKLGDNPIEREHIGLGNRLFFRFFSVERLMPIMFVFGYAIFLAYTLPWWESLLGPRPEWLDIITLR